MKKLLALALVPFFWQCGSKSHETTATSDSTVVSETVIKIDGSSTVYPITESVTEEFNAKSPQFKVTIGISGTGGGFKRFMRSEIDIADASRAIKASEDSSCTAAGIQ
ncbi:MAG TPA: substrate-binding domain-containing protein, partial [Cytophagaceae bacterium]|nr:substrate-binding domain-containing protein [Cytophagaceae bacterium]